MSLTDSAASLADIAAALAKAQLDFKAITKNRTAKVVGMSKAGKPYNYEYKYADLAQIMDAVRRPLAENNLVVIQDVIVMDSKHWLATTILHASGQRIANGVPIIAPTDPGPQGFGISMSYARRHGMSALLALTADDDSDGHGLEGGDHFTVSDATSGDPAEHPQMKAARSVTELSKTMNALSAEEQRLYKTYFDIRRAELASQRL